MAKIADRIEVNPDKHHGKPVIEGTSVPVHMVLGLLGNDVSIEEITNEYYSNITRENILACVKYAKSIVEEVHPIGNRNGE